MVHTPQIIILTGPSGAGKTTLARYLVEHSHGRYEHIRQDDYLKDPRTFPMEGEFQIWEDPGNVDFDVLASHIRELKSGRTVEWRTFSKSADEPVYRYTIEPRPVIIIEGTLLLTNGEIRYTADSTFYLDVPLDISLLRRAIRAREWGIDLATYDKMIMIPAYDKYRHLRSLAEHVLDGTRPIEELASEVDRCVVRARAADQTPRSRDRSREE